jgi:hypothetical protein
MLRSLMAVAIFALTLSSYGVVPPELGAALEKLSEGRERWAYTETKINYNPDGTVKDETIFQIDPSKPYPEQRIPIKIRGRAPTEKELKKYRERGEKKAEARARAARLASPPTERSSRTFASLPFDLERVTLHAEDTTTATYRVSLIKTDKQPIPPEKCAILVRIDKQTQTLENISIKLMDSVRIKAVVKLKDGHFNFDFAPVHPDFPPVLTSTQMKAHASLFFKGFAQDSAIKRTDFRRVKPYDERFEVKIGPTEILDL